MIDKDTLFLSIKDKIPSDSLEACKESIDNANADELSKVALLNIKNPVIALLLSLFLGVFGVDRFYKGDVKLGILKPVLFFGSYILTLVCSFIYLDSERSGFNLLFVFVVLFGVLLIGTLIWCIVDIFLVYFGIKKDNLAKIYSVFSK